MSSHLPRVVVAGPRSGVGKTSVATGLMAALAARGLAVSGHKVGPDFIDPGYHALATGRPPRNLDAVLHGPERLPGLLRHGAAGADVAVIEGVMGLFDGRGADDEASTAHVARVLDAPVVLVVDAAATSRSIAAEVHGFATFDPTVRIAGVICNRVGSEGHAQLVRDALAPLGIPVLGVVHRDDRLAAPSRHLGLVPAAERAPQARATVARLGEAVAAAVDLDGLLALARSAPPLAAATWVPEVRSSAGPRPRVAVAGGPAFTFMYTEHRELLTAAGAEVVTFDPTVDEGLPPGTAGLVVGGGFPEAHAHDLAANRPLRDDVRALASAGAPVVGECGGLVALCRDLDDVPMWGVLPARARFTDRLVLGYRTAVAAADSVLGPAGTAVPGHEFHRTTVAPAAGPCPAWQLAEQGPEGHVAANVHASYLHASWVAAPVLPATFVAAARAHDRTVAA